MRSCWGQTTTSGECLIQHLNFDEDRQLLAFESTDGMKVEVYKGDITKETAEAIVSSVDSKYSMNVGVSKAIATSAGKELKQSCKAKLKADGSLKVIISMFIKLRLKVILFTVLCVVVIQLFRQI